MSRQAHRFCFPRQGVLFLLSAPSGTGKTTLAQRLLDRVSGLSVSVSYTTRPPRPGEVDGRAYHFVSEAEFARLRRAHAFVEWAEVHGALYGTAHAVLDAAVSRGRDLLLEIDVQGARHIKNRYPQAVAIFLLPPSWQELERRLRSRATDSAQTIARRLTRGRQEARQLAWYDYCVVNERLDEAEADLVAIIRTERARVARFTRSATLQSLLGPQPDRSSAAPTLASPDGHEQP